MPAPEQALLRTGQTAPAKAVASTMVQLRKVAEADPAAFYELVAASRDRTHVLWRDTARVLIDLGLVRQLDADGLPVIHDIVRATVLSAVTGEDETMAIRSPFAESSP